MGLSLKREEMIEFLEAAKMPGESFNCMLWGTVYADISNFYNHSVASIIMSLTFRPGVAGLLDNAFCYIGLTEQSVYVVALDSYNTSKITGQFALPYENIASMNISKAPFGVSHTVTIECGELVSLTVKSTSIGTNIKDQKTRMELFLVTMEKLKADFRE